MTPTHAFTFDDNRALICGFRFGAVLPAEGAMPERLVWSDIARPDSDLRSTWLHFDLVDVRAGEWISDCEQLPERARDILLSADEYVRFERVGKGIAAVIGDFDHDLHADADEIGVFRLYLDREIFVTARRHPLKSTDRLRRELLEKTDVEAPIDAFERLLLHVSSTFTAVTTSLDKLIDRIEDKLLGGSYRDDGRELGRARRLLAQVRRNVGSQRTVELRTMIPEGCTEEEAAQVRRAVASLFAISQEVEGLQVRARLLQDEMGARVSEQINRNIYFLSIFTAIFLPITLISGIFGMNLQGIPWAENDHGFWIVVILIVVMALLTLLLLRWRKII